MKLKKLMKKRQTKIKKIEISKKNGNRKNKK